MTTDAPILNIVIGTSGHIDHGKSTLVRRLTGIDPDRLKEEKEREMTIDLGFAPLVLPSGRKVGIIDVPGHEKFIKNMVAGATGIDLALLIIAADDGVMPQTREHLDIMDFLGIQRGLVAITKCDMTEPDLAELVVEEVADFCRGTFLEGAPIIRASGITGEGIDDLLGALDDMVDTIEQKVTSGVFRMPIQRVFSAKGFGTVVTGVPVTGEIKTGDDIEILPQGFRGRVRSIQAYKESAETGQAGHSTAINISDVDYRTVHRGDVACTPGIFEGSTLIEASFHYLNRAKRPLQNRTTVRVHAGTSEVIGEVVILEGKVLQPGQKGFIQLRLRDPLVVAPDDKFILRLHSPMMTIGGGVILGTTQYRLKAGKQFVLENLTEKLEALGDSDAYLESVLHAENKAPLDVKELARRTRLTPEAIQERLDALVADGVVLQTPRGQRYLHRDTAQRGERRTLQVLEDFFAGEKLKLHMDLREFRSALKLDEALLELVFDRLQKSGALVIDKSANRVSLPGRGAALDPQQTKRLESLTALYLEARFQTPRPEDAATTIGATDPKDQKDVSHLIGLLVDQGVLVKVAPNVLFHQDALNEAKQELAQAFSDQETLEAKEFKNRIDSTRKYVIPLLEYFDNQGLTVLKDGVRKLTEVGRNDLF